MDTSGIAEEIEGVALQVERTGDRIVKAIEDGFGRIGRAVERLGRADKKAAESISDHVMVAEEKLADTLEGLTNTIMEGMAMTVDDAFSLDRKERPFTVQLERGQVVIRTSSGVDHHESDHKLERVDEDEIGPIVAYRIVDCYRCEADDHDCPVCGGDGWFEEGIGYFEEQSDGSLTKRSGNFVKKQAGKHDEPLIVEPDRGDPVGYLCDRFGVNENIAKRALEGDELDGDDSEPELERARRLV